ncbi:hypothetical protein AYO45_00360 [Gammaproteobacteria bacterium SCGC AG-212-F23]|nr:hypothetical protein AYO45_00360 [Gammaproteobacteria bacterium SCGC AG-212-F23]
MTIANWPINEQPQEKLLEYGAKHLSDAELLAIFLRTGIRGKTALDIARELLQECGDLKKLCSMEAHYFFQKKGLGKAKYAMLKAALELGKRFLYEELPRGTPLKNSIETKRFLQSRLQHYTREVFAVLFLDNHYRVITFEELFFGTLTEASVYPREVVIRALAHNAAKVILTHNHPSGNSAPSESDHILTAQIRQALALVDIDVIDHVIIGRDESVSFVETGVLAK